MQTLNNAQSLTPRCQILINGIRTPPDLEADLSGVTIAQDLEAASMFTLQLSDWDLVQYKPTWVDTTLFVPGNQVEIQMGYENSLKTLIVGEITGLDAEFSPESAPTMTVRGYDLRHRLMRGVKTRTFLQMKDSDIARQIASGANLIGNVKDTEIKREYVLQHSQSDLDFLRKLADRNGYEVIVENKILYFRPRQHTTRQSFSLDVTRDRLDFSVQLSTMKQVGQVEVYGWDAKQKEPFISKAIAMQELVAMGGSTTGPKLANREFGKAIHAIVDQAIASKAEADKLAKAKLEEIALEYITGDGSCPGRSDLRPGLVVGITGVGNRFSGPYYITSTIHSYSKRQGYRTSFSVKRNATQ